MSASNDDDESSSLPSSGDEDDAEEEEDPLEQLHRLGFAGGEAVDALMQCGGNFEQARQQLLATAAADASSDSKPTPSFNTKAGKGGRNKKKGKNKSSSSNDTAAATPAAPSSEQEQGKSKNSNNSSSNHKKNFKEQRKQELRFQKALRDQRRVCRVCGGPHPRKECPGIADDGRGHSLHRDPRTRKKENQQRKDFEAQKQKDEEFLQMGVWTRAVVPYYDCFADLVQAYRQQHHHDQRSSLHPRHRSLSFDDGTSEDETLTTTSPSERQTIINEGLAGWILDWATLNVKLGEDPIHTLSPEQRKVELQSWSGSRLQKATRALSADDHQERVDAALRDRNPRSALIRILLAAPQPELLGDAPPRTLHREWPGYRGCVAPFSVLDASAMDALEQLQKYYSYNSMSTTDHEKNDARASAKNGVKALLSIPPADVAQWMVVAATEDGSTTNNNSNKTEADSVVPIDLSFFTREAEEMERTQAASKRAQAQLLANGGSSKKGRASAEAEVTKLRKAMAGQRARQVDSAEVLQGAAQALLSPTVRKSLDDALEKAQTRCDDENSTRVVVGISCGLDYDTAEARHSVLGKAVRTAQKAACQYAIVAAAKFGLPVVLECQDATATNELPDQQQAGSSDSSASSDLVRILVEAAPPEMTLVLRNGPLTTATKPGVQKLLDTWPKLYLGMSASLAYSKCPKELLDVAYDVPLERLCLMSEAPFCLPPALSGSHLVGDCAPPHVACVAEIVADIKSGTDSINREEVLRRSANLASGVFGFTATMNEN